MMEIKEQYEENTERVCVERNEISQIMSQAEKLRVDGDYKESFNLYLKAAELGDSLAQLWVGNFYNRGLGREKDAKNALLWYEKAARQNNADAHNNIGAMYMDGKGVEQNYDMAIAHFEKALTLGSEAVKNNLSIAYNNLAVRYIDGCGVNVDYEYANILLKKALHLGNKTAESNFANLQNLIQQEANKALTVQTAWVAIGMWICIIIGAIVFISCVMHGQYVAGLVCAALAAAIGYGVYYCGPKIVKEHMEEIEEKGKYIQYHGGVRCPNCGMKAGHNISDISKKASIGFWGIASNKIGKTYECANCKHMW